MPSEVRVIGIPGLPDITPGVDLAEAIARAARPAGISFEDGDVLVVTQKIVSKSEGNLVNLHSVTPSRFAREAAQAQDRDPRLLEVVLRQTRRIVKMDQRTIITETRHGLVCANAGVDESNVGENMAALLPADADQSARRLRSGLMERTGVDLAIIISDTFGRPWREGFVNVAIGVAGMEPLRDYRGVPDTAGHVLKATILAVADELASAAELVMGKLDKVPVAIVRGYDYQRGDGSARQLVRPRETDLFR